MTRIDEQELQGVADRNPPAVEALKRRRAKPALAKLRSEVKPPSAEYTPISYAPRDAIAHVPEDCTTPIEYFRLYITKAHCDLIAKHTNMQAVAEIIKRPPSRYSRSRLWKSIDGGHISRFMGIILAMGLAKMPETAHYWSTATDVARNIEISQAMGLVTFQEIKRYLKISNPLTDKVTYNTTYWPDKLEPLLTDFLKASRRHLTPGRDVSVDEQLEGFRGRSLHTLTIDSKQAGTGFKSYCLCWENYLLGLKYTSKIAKITGLKKSPGLDLPDTQAVVVQLLQELPQPRYHWVYTDNFFTSSKLACRLAELNMALIGTCKANSGVSESLLKLKEVATKEKHWGIKEVTTEDVYEAPKKRKRAVEQEEKKKLGTVLCVAWQDNNTTLIMSTAHTPEEAIREDVKNYRHYKRRKNIPPTSVINEAFLPWPQCIVDYNNNMGGVDGNAQMQASYSASIYSEKYWFNLFKGLLLKTIVNSYILFKLANKNERITHYHWIQEISSHLMRTPAGGLGVPPNNPHFGENLRPLNTPFEHRKIRLNKQQYCTPCTENGRVSSTIPRRMILGDISSNGTRKRPPKTWTGCAAKACKGKAVCKAIRCWEELHDH